MPGTDVQHPERLRTYWKRHHAFPSMAKLCEVVGLSATASVFDLVSRPKTSGSSSVLKAASSRPNAFSAVRSLAPSAPAWPRPMVVAQLLTRKAPWARTHGGRRVAGQGARPPERLEAQTSTGDDMKTPDWVTASGEHIALAHLLSADGSEAFAPNSKTREAAVFAYEELPTRWRKLTFGARTESVSV